MKSQHEDQKLTEGQQMAKKPRFKIEKLEERIAPCHSLKINPQGKEVGHGSQGQGRGCR